MSILPPSDGGAQVGEVVASYAEYEAAQKAVSQLIQADVTARDVAIVGTGLRSVERVTGKLGFGTAARSGAINGLILGLLLSVIFVLPTPGAPLGLILGVMLIGVALGMGMSLIMLFVLRRRRDYASVMQVVADHYDVTVLPNSIHRAREVLGTAPQRTPVPRTQPAGAPAQPPRYGERLPEGAPRPQAQQSPPQPQRDPASEPPRYGERIQPPVQQPPAAAPPAAVPPTATPPVTASPTALPPVAVPPVVAPPTVPVPPVSTPDDAPVPPPVVPTIDDLPAEPAAVDPGDVNERPDAPGANESAR